MKPVCEIHRLGWVAYEAAWRLQEEWAAEIGRGERRPALLLLEHPHTFTFGRRGSAANLLWDQQELARRGVAVHWVDRGGDITYHGPGQLVGYPLLPLAPPTKPASGPPGSPQTIPKADYVGYLRRLEEMLIRTLACLGVTGFRREGLTGVWVQPGKALPAKIAAIGVKVDAQGITRHGFALNVNPDMTFWEGMIGCGLKGETAISLAELIQPVPIVDEVIGHVVGEFGEVFGYKMHESR